MRRKRLRRLSRSEPPLGPAGAMALRHRSIVANPQHWMPRVRDVPLRNV
jgi:hypothetical protein